MKLYTVQVTFEDFTFAVEQYEADTPEHAIELFFSKAGCFQDYNREELLNVMRKRIQEKSALIHLGNNLRGIWLINTGTEFLDFPGELQAIFGGKVIQTDPHGPRRSG
jgi:hypothetical protein